MVSTNTTPSLMQFKFENLWILQAARIPRSYGFNLIKLAIFKLESLTINYGLFGRAPTPASSAAPAGTLPNI